MFTRANKILFVVMLIVVIALTYADGEVEADLEPDFSGPAVSGASAGLTPSSYDPIEYVDGVKACSGSSAPSTIRMERYGKEAVQACIKSYQGTTLVLQLTNTLHVTVAYAINTGSESTGIFSLINATGSADCRVVLPKGTTEITVDVPATRVATFTFSRLGPCVGIYDVLGAIVRAGTGEDLGTVMNSLAAFEAMLDAADLLGVGGTLPVSSLDVSTLLIMARDFVAAHPEWVNARLGANIAGKAVPVLNAVIIGSNLWPMVNQWYTTVFQSVILTNMDGVSTGTPGGSSPPSGSACEVTRLSPEQDSWPALTALTLRLGSACELQARVVGGPYGSEGAATPRFRDTFSWMQGLWAASGGESPVRVEVRTISSVGATGPWQVVLYIGTASGSISAPPNIPPTLDWLNVPKVCTSDDVIEIAWQVSDAETGAEDLTVEIRLNGGAFVPAPDGTNWARFSNLPEGRHRLEARVGDGSATTSREYDFEIDRSAPEIAPISVNGARDRNKIYRSNLDVNPIEVTDRGCAGVGEAVVRGLEFGWTPVSEPVVLSGSGIRMLFVRATDTLGNSILVKTNVMLLSQAVVSQAEGCLKIHYTTNVRILGALDIPCYDIRYTTDTTLSGPVHVKDTSRNVASGNVNLSVQNVVASTFAFPKIAYPFDVLCSMADTVYNGDVSLSPTGAQWDKKLICVKGTLTLYSTAMKGDTMLVVEKNLRYRGTGDVLASADAGADQTGLVVLAGGTVNFEWCSNSVFTGHVLAHEGILGLGTGCEFRGSLISSYGTRLTGTGSTVEYEAVIEASTYELELSEIDNATLAQILLGQVAVPVASTTPTATPTAGLSSTATPSPTATPTKTSTPTPTITPPASQSPLSMTVDNVSLTVRRGRSVDFQGDLISSAIPTCQATVNIVGLPSSFSVFKDYALMSGNEREDYGVKVFVSLSQALGTYSGTLTATCGSQTVTMPVSLTVTN